MGRSQVKRNQQQGRPGQKGRGGGRGPPQKASQKQQQQRPLGDNAWRYQEQQDISGDDKLEDELLALESHGNYSHQVTTTNNEEEEDVTTTTATFKLDVDAINTAMSTISLSEILNLPPYLTAPLETQSRRGPKSEKAVATTTTTGITVQRSTDNNKPPPPSIADHPTAQENDAAEEDNEDDDDMESWLDSVIS